MDLPDHLLLPSPNGSALTVAAQQIGVRHVLAGCARNASATAQRAAALAGGGPIAVIAAGEVSDDGSLRPAIEDLVGSGAILSASTPLDRSPESRIASVSFDAARSTPLDRRPVGLTGDCVSARELAAIGRRRVAVATQFDVSRVAAGLRDGAYGAVED